MTVKERREAIRRHLELNGEASISRLAAEFSDWSEMTIRRDLDQLARSRHIILTRGGARTMPLSYGVSEDIYSERENRNAAAKQLIAGKAAELVEPGAGIFIDAGTTAMAFARRLPDYKMVVVASAPNIALEIAVKKANPSIILLGGTLSRHSMAVSDPALSSQLDNLNIDTAFLAASGFDEAAGFSVGSQEHAMLKRAVAARARRVVMLLDSSKIGAMLPFTFARPEDVDIIVADDAMPAHLKKKLGKITTVI